jgi:NADH-quinone oxidoreductase subunit N
MPDTAVPTINPHDFYYLAAEIVLAVWGLVVLMVDFGLLRRRPSPARQRVLGWLTMAGTLATLGVLLYLRGLYIDPSGANDPDPYILFGFLAGDILTFWMNVAITLMLALVVAMSMAWRFTDHWGEYYALLLWAAVGMMLLVAAEELLTLFLTLETMTLCLYLATAFEKDRRRSAEGGLKYFVYGSVSSALFLFGLSLIYGLTGTTRLSAIQAALSGSESFKAMTGLAGNVAGATAVLLVMVGFGFKIAAVPFHQWAPDAYEGAPAPVTAWIAAGSKVASFVAMMKVLSNALAPWASGSDRLTSPGWIGVVAVIAAVSMTYGNFAALAQRNLKRMLAYSSIAHAGYILVGVLAAAVSRNGKEAAGSVLFYLVTYGFTTVGAFALAAWLARDSNRDDIDDLNGLGYRSPGLAVCIVILMLSLIGMPPLAGFFGKLYMFMEALRTQESGHLTLIGLVALGLANSVVSAFYYVRVLKAMFLREPGRTTPAPDAPGGVRWPIVAATAVALIFGIYPDPLLNSMRAAAVPMLSGGSQGMLLTGARDRKFVTEPKPLDPSKAYRPPTPGRSPFAGVSPGGGGAPRPSPKAATPPGSPPTTKSAPRRGQR